MHGEKRNTALWCENLKEKGYLETQVGDNIRMYLKEIGREHVEWIYVAKDNKKWAIVVTVVNFGIP